MDSSASIENVLKNSPVDILNAFLDHEEKLSFETNSMHKQALEKLLQQVIKASARSIGILYQVMQKCFEKKHALAMHVGKVISSHLVEKTTKRKTSSSSSSSSGSSSSAASRKRWPPGIPKINKPVDMCEIIVTKPDKFSDEAVLRARLYLRQIKKAIPPSRANEILSHFQFKEDLPVNITPKTPMVGKKRARVEKKRAEEEEEEEEGDEEEEDDDE